MSGPSGSSRTRVFNVVDEWLANQATLRPPQTLNCQSRTRSLRTAALAVGMHRRPLHVDRKYCSLYSTKLLLKVVYMEVVKCVERQHDRDDIDTPEIFARNIFLLDLDLVREYFHISGTLVRHGRKSK